MNANVVTSLKSLIIFEKYIDMQINFVNLCVKNSISLTFKNVNIFRI